MRAARVKLAADARKKDADPAKGAAIQAAQFEFEQRRYRSEATLNQEIGFVYEARVKVSSAESDKHRKKSQTLFIAMLVAQIGGVISSLALARKKKSALWLFAGAAGLVAIGFGGYVLPATSISRSIFGGRRREPAGALKMAYRRGLTPPHR